MPPMRIDAPMPNWSRMIIVVIGLAVIGLPAWELWRGVWPPNIFSPFVLLIVLGACTLGLPAIVGGLTGWADTWTVAPGRIEIERRNPFTTRRLVFLPADVARIETVEHEAMEGDNTFSVVLTSTSGVCYDSQRRFQTRKFSDEFAGEIQRAFRG